MIRAPWPQVLAGLAASGSGPAGWPAEWCGAVGGAGLGALGWLFGWLMVRRQRRGRGRSAGQWDVWGMWVAGLLARLAVLGLLVVWFRARFDPGAMRRGLLVLAAVYLASLAVETWRLYRAMTADGTAEGS